MLRGKQFLMAMMAGASLLAGFSRPGALAAHAARAARPDTERTAVESTSEELRFVDLANRERVGRGLKPLTIDPMLIVVAREHSREMMEKNYFDHNSPTPGIKTPMDRYLKELGFRPRYACVGENLYYCTIADVERGHQAFMNSASHRENLLYPRFEKMGVGIQRNHKGEFWVTEMFLSNAGR